MKVLKRLDLENEINIISLAKKNEEIFIPNTTKSLQYEKENQGVKLLRRIRDESHRYAITYHRKRRTKRMTRSVLRDIPGIGPHRIRDILDYFKSVDAIRIASVEELLKVNKVGKKTAKEIWNYFNSEENNIETENRREL